jgi:hypothetical protein
MYAEEILTYGIDRLWFVLTITKIFMKFCNVSWFPDKSIFVPTLQHTLENVSVFD